MTAETPEQESRRRARIKDYTCGLCGGEFGSNCHPGDISCTECEARLCPCCGTWFTELGDMSAGASHAVTAGGGGAAENMPGNIPPGPAAAIDPVNWQLVGRNGLGEVSVAAPLLTMTREQALAHAAWLVFVADDEDEFGAYLSAVRRTLWTGSLPAGNWTGKARPGERQDQCQAAVPGGGNRALQRGAPDREPLGRLKKAAVNAHPREPPQVLRSRG